MFSFHKPKVYRSTTGCCICKAKSSSSRFTDSKKYEFDFIRCFQLKTPRRGEICNACVLLVKRFKRLPPGSDRHWGHVVDARIGPGTKSMTKFKRQRREGELAASGKKDEPAKDGEKVKKKSDGGMMSLIPHRFAKIFKKKKKLVPTKDHSGSSDDLSSPNSPLSAASDAEPMDDHDPDSRSSSSSSRREVKFKRKSRPPFKNAPQRQLDVLDPSLWQQRRTCCGVVFESVALQALVVDLACYKPCRQHSTPPPGLKQHVVAEDEENMLDRPADDLLIKLTDEQIQENYENAALSGFNKILKVSDLFNSNGGPAAGGGGGVGVPTRKTPAKRCAEEVLKMKAPKFKSGGDVKSLAKVCAERSVRGKIEGIGNGGGAIPATLVGGKFVSDNSSDSGYEETVQEQVVMSAPLSLPAPQARPVVLSNGIKLHVQPQNLALAANLAGVVPPSSRSQPVLPPTSSTPIIEKLLTQGTLGDPSASTALNLAKSTSVSSSSISSSTSTSLPQPNGGLDTPTDLSKHHANIVLKPPYLPQTAAN